MAYDPAKHLIRIQGNREYLPVAQRLVWFRESHPDWGIETKIEVLDTDAGLAVFSATVINENGKVMARATKMETARGFPDYIEKAETGAIGRALALCGFGTQFAPELEEGERVVDSPHPVGGRPVASGRIGAAADAAHKIAPAAVRGGEARMTSAPSEGSGSLVCSEAPCGRSMTQGQYEFSVKSFGRALCPQCQKQHKTEPAAAA
ncbi:MAG TPA: hypothetical protein GX715_07220 [Armatimonadetes bacterium]|jgi:hypothetical protein|nr:hypothetical protein [Armatimonadota bacterium]